MRGFGYSKLSEQLFSETAELVVSPRRRLVNRTVVVDNPGDNEVQLPLKPQDNLIQPGDGFLIEWAALSLLPGSTNTVVVTSAALFVGTGPTAPGGNPIGIADTEAATGNNAAGSSGQGASFMFFDLTPKLRLMGSQDFSFLLGFPTPLKLTAANQPLAFFVEVNFTDGGAAAQNVGAIAVMFYRLVRGLQEN